MSAESRTTVWLALGANAGIAAGKLAAGLASGSSVMLAEAAHSLGDTTNQAFLLTALRRGGKAPDAVHPFGYGKERFFWSLLAAVGIFVAGGVFSVYEGIHSLFAAEQEQPSYLVNYAVLALAVLLEGASLLRALGESRRAADREGRTLFEHLRVSTDPTVKTVVLEDSAAVAGIVLATTGLALHQLTDNAVWDAAAAVGVGLLLIVVAFLLGRDTKELLIGEALDAPSRLVIYDLLQDLPEVDRVVELQTMLLGPASVLVAVRLDLGVGLDSAQIEEFSSRTDRELQERLPKIQSVFLDATAATGEGLDKANRLSASMKQIREAGKAEAR